MAASLANDPVSLVGDTHRVRTTRVVVAVGRTLDELEVVRDPHTMSRE